MGSKSNLPTFVIENKTSHVEENKSLLDLAEEEERGVSRVNQRLSRKRILNPLGYDPRGFIHLNLLALRAKDRPKCELCNNTGHLMCEHCKVTFYCLEEHFSLDKPFHSKICHTIKVLRQPLEFSPLLETRDRLKKQRRLHMEELFNLSLRWAQGSLEKSAYNEAIPAATVATNYAEILWGQSEDMITPMLIAAEAYLYKGNLNLAEGFLARALFIELNLSYMKPFIKSKIRHNEGIIAMAKGKTRTALQSFADQVYQAAEEHGPEHRRTALGYCNMGRLFHNMGNYVTSNSLFRQVVTIWSDVVTPILAEMTTESFNPLISGIKYQEVVWMTDTDKSEAKTCLSHCRTHQTHCLRILYQQYVTHLDLANTCYALSVLNYICKNFEESHSMTVEGSQHLVNHPTPDRALAKKFSRMKKLLNTGVSSLSPSAILHRKQSDHASWEPSHSGASLVAWNDNEKQP